MNFGIPEEIDICFRSCDFLNIKAFNSCRKRAVFLLIPKFFRFEYLEKADGLE